MLCTIHPSSSKLLRVKTKGFTKLKVQKSNSRVQEQDGRVNSYSEVLIGGNTQGECHVNMKKAQGMGIFTLESLSEKAQGVTITDCHAGNPCVHICDPTSQSKYPMIGMNKGWRLKGACKSAQTLEAKGRGAYNGRAPMDFTGLFEPFSFCLAEASKTYQWRSYYSVPTTEGMEKLLFLPKINADHFEIKTNLLQLVQANPFYGRENDNPHAHINSFKRITSTLRFRNVPNDVIKLMMFPYSLEGAPKIVRNELPNSFDLGGISFQFVNQFFPPSKTTHLKNEISRFTQKFEETFSEAWERFKEF
ncbi:hypothetical protein Tco_0066041 [Tanacetum coccineum]